MGKGCSGSMSFPRTTLSPVSTHLTTQKLSKSFGDFMAASLHRQASLAAQTVKNLPAMQEVQDQSLGQEDPLEKEMQPTPVSLPGESHKQRSLTGYSTQVAKSLT